ncbi:unnamed protein product [Moneuplotes crassus]|uniref:Uncharacterized protein n=1 Tax=Euplotes crassus TaxID=5936 RepID=A0AAD1UC18_EUPCR|nr:unnamed protein product [Moneuplotes crassus]
MEKRAFSPRNRIFDNLSLTSPQIGLKYKKNQRNYKIKVKISTKPKIKDSPKRSKKLHYFGRRKVYSISPPPVHMTKIQNLASLTHQSRFSKAGYPMALQSPISNQNFTVCSPSTTRQKKRLENKATNIKISRRMRQSPLEILKCRIRSLSPYKTQVIDFGDTYLPKRSNKKRKRQKTKNSKALKPNIPISLAPLNEEISDTFRSTIQPPSTSPSKILSKWAHPPTPLNPFQIHL